MPGLLYSTEYRDAINVQQIISDSGFFQTCINYYKEMHDWRPKCLRTEEDAAIVKRKADRRYWNNMCRKSGWQTEIAHPSAHSPWSQVQQFRREPAGEDTAKGHNDVAEDSILSDRWIAEYWARNAMNVAMH